MSDLRSRRQFVREGVGVVSTAALASGLAAAGVVRAGQDPGPDRSKIVNYNPDMEYRRLGKTGLMVSAVALGGHWKRIDTMIGKDADVGVGWDAKDVTHSAFLENRDAVVSRCIERGINYIDACCGAEVMAYSSVLKGRRDKMILGFSWYETESRFPEWRNRGKLLESLDAGMKKAGLDYVDIWRITLLENSIDHTAPEIEEAMAALETARRSGRVRFTGISSHHRPHIKGMIETYPEAIQVILTPYTADTKVVSDEAGLWATIKEREIGWFGIKPFASNSLFQGDSSPGSPQLKTDNRLARLAIRYILCNPAITAPIPGLISAEQVDNVALAVKERRTLDVAELDELRSAMERAWAGLPNGYGWLRQWEYV